MKRIFAIGKIDNLVLTKSQLQTEATVLLEEISNSRPQHSRETPSLDYFIWSRSAEFRIDQIPQFLAQGRRVSNYYASAAIKDPNTDVIDISESSKVVRLSNQVYRQVPEDSTISMINTFVLEKHSPENCGCLEDASYQTFLSEGRYLIRNNTKLEAIRGVLYDTVE